MYSWHSARLEIDGNMLKKKYSECDFVDVLMMQGVFDLNRKVGLSCEKSNTC
jgi:hypothetical protein